MKFKFFMVSAISPEYGQEMLNIFCAKHRVVSVEKHLISQGNDSFWTVCVSYTDSEVIVAKNTSTQNDKQGRIDYKELLSEQDFVIFAEIRNLRKSLAIQAGIPVYAIFTNEQLAEMVTTKVITLDSLASIAGIGKARIEKYGDRFIAELNRLFNATARMTDETLLNSNS